MKQQFGNFEFDKDNSVSILNYNRSSKDWFDILSSLLIGLLSASVVFYIINAMIKDFSWIDPLILLVFGFVAFLKISYSISRLLEPTKKLISINKNSGTVELKSSKFKSQTVNLSDISLITYNLNKDEVDLTDQDSSTIIKNRFWIEVIFLTKNKQHIKAFNINPSHIFDKGDYKTKEILLSKSKKLLKKLARELEVEYRYKGFIEHT